MGLERAADSGRAGVESQVAEHDDEHGDEQEHRADESNSADDVDSSAREETTAKVRQDVARHPAAKLGRA